MNKEEAVSISRNIGRSDTMHHLDLEWLWDHACRYKYIAEVGVFVGRSTTLMARACAQNGGVVFAIDTFSGSMDIRDYTFGQKREEICAEFLKNTAGLDNIVPVICDSARAAEYLPMVDMAFIDADHRTEAVKRDAVAWMGRTKYLLCGHDANLGSVRDAVVELFGEQALIPGSALWKVGLGGVNE